MDITLEYGDAVERENAGWLRANIPEYEELWSRVIGHDGRGHPLPLNPHLRLKGFNREAFYQAHYTVLVTLLNLRRLAADYDANLPTVQNASDYLKLQGDITSFMAHVGRIRDLFKMMDGCFARGPSGWAKFDDFYSQRNNVLHNAIPSIKLDGGLPSLPQLASRSADAGAWTSSSNWDESREMNFKLVSQFFVETCNSLFPLIRSGLSKYLSFFKEHASGALPKLQVSQPPAAPSSTMSTPRALSGSFGH